LKTRYGTISFASGMFEVKNVLAQQTLLKNGENSEIAFEDWQRRFLLQLGFRNCRVGLRTQIQQGILGL